MDQVFNLIMEQDAAFFDRMKTGSRAQASLLLYILRSRSAILMRCC